MYDVSEHCDASTPVVLVGAKCDMIANRVVSKKDGAALAREFKVSFFECSSKNGINVEVIFDQIAREIVEACELDSDRNKGKFITENTKFIDNNDVINKSKCCNV